MMKLWAPLLMFLVSGCQPAEESAESAPPSAVEFANPELLVETGWLSQQSSSERLRIVDARSQEDYEAGHIPGAVNIPRPTTFAPSGERSRIGPPEQIAALFGAQGINETVHVVVYDEGLSTAASRVFWTLEYYGHPQASVLNGGFTKWVAESREVATEAPGVTPVIFDAIRNEAKLSTREGILKDLGVVEAVMLDSRSPEEFSGETLHSERGGHIPEAVNIEWTRNFVDGDAPVFKSAAELAAMYEQEGVTRDKRVHTY